MSNMSDVIEAYIKRYLEAEEAIELKRNEMALHFQCVPSQINYVINTRFTTERGYTVESKRGGGGYIRIVKVRLSTHSQLVEALLNLLEDKEITENVATDVTYRLYKENVVTEREANLMMVSLRQNLLGDKTGDNEIRKQYLRAFLEHLKYAE